MLEQTFINTLAELVAADSVYGNEANARTLYVDLLEQAGFEVSLKQVSEGRSNIFGIKNPSTSKKAVLFYGHQDTVEVAKDWQLKPHELTVEGDKAYGLGAFDMKSGIAAFVEANRDSQAYCKVFLAVDEENISEGGWHAATHEKAFFEDVALAISAEPSLTAGANSITVGRTGRQLFNVTFTGKSAHLANYQTGTDAIELQAVFLNEFYKQRKTIFDDNGSTAQVREVSSKVVGMSVPEEARCVVEVLSSAEHNSETTKALLEGFSDSAEVVLAERKTPYLQGYHNPEFPFKAELEAAVESAFSDPAEYITRRSVGDDNVLAGLGIPVITWGPTGGNAHSAEEYVDLSSLEKLIAGYSSFLAAITTKQ
jgi:succinyl-diaminopimelate desuccinylase